VNHEAQRGIRDYLQALVKIMGRMPRPDQQSPHEFMLKHGRAFEVTPATYKGPRGAPKQCYSNAGRIALKNAAAKGPPLYYAEGYVTSVGIPIPHAFLVNGRGEVIDPTLRGPCEVGGERAYFGLVFDPAYFAAALVAGSYWGLLDSLASVALHDIIKGTTEGMLATLPCDNLPIPEG
jgi:hypothetical protein